MVFILSLILAFFIWLIHNLSLDYSTYLQFRIIATTDIEGYDTKSVSEETLVLHGRAPGLFFLKNGRLDGMPKDLELTLSADVFNRDQERDDVFLVYASDIREALSEFFGEQLEIDYINNEALHFQFERATCKKVEVVVQNTISYRPQYMLVGDIALTPDSVMVYGKESDLNKISSVRTRVISKRSVDKSINGFVNLERIPGVRIDETRVQYSMNVQRYVELTEDVRVESVNVPSGRTFLVLPSSVAVTYRVPIRALNDREANADIKLFVDYDKYAESNSSKVVPVVESSNMNIFSCELDPPFVECIMVEK